MNKLLISLAIFASQSFACHTPGHQAQAQGRRMMQGLFSWPLLDDSTNGITIPMSGFKCRAPISTDKIVQTNLMRSMTCNSDYYMSTEMFLYSCFSTCMNQYCAQDFTNPIAPIIALQELVIFLSSTDWYHTATAECEEDEICWQAQVDLLEKNGALMSKTDLPRDADVFPALNQCIVELASNHHD